MGKKKREDDTLREDLLLLILRELRELRQQHDERFDRLVERIDKLERQVELIRNEQQRLGQEFELHRTECSKRLDLCTQSDMQSDYAKKSL
jgi:uncharacterized protein YdcH (DUF465 family)